MNKYLNQIATSVIAASAEIGLYGLPATYGSRVEVGGRKVHFNNWYYLSYMCKASDSNEDICYTQPGMKAMQRAIERTIRGHVLSALTQPHDFQREVGHVVESVPQDHAKKLRINVVEHLDVEDIISIDGTAYGLVDVGIDSNGQYALTDRPFTAPITEGASIRVARNFASRKYETSDDGLVFYAPQQARRPDGKFIGSNATSEHISRHGLNMDVIRDPGEGEVTTVISMLTGVYVDSSKCRLLN